jgi:hypothetical protein
MALAFICFADLSEAQRERMTSSLTLQGQRVQTYTFAVVREVMIELFCAPRSSLDNPNLRASGSEMKAFVVLDEGELDGADGYWVEDEETGEEGFLNKFEDVFWTYDDMSWSWVARSFQGRRMRKGKGKGGLKGKGKGSKGRGYFRPFGQKGKGKDGTAHYEASGEALAAYKGKGKKGKGKKGKASQGKPEAGKGKGPFEGKGLAVDSQPAQAAPVVMKGQEDQHTHREWGDDWRTYDDTPGQYYTNFVKEISENTVHSSWLNIKIDEPKNQWEVLDLERNPLYVILDLGCTRAMGSRPAIMRFAKAAPVAGLYCEFLPSNANFSFANSETGHCKEKLRIWFKTAPASWTDIDILEQGNVPILMSLGQMRNMKFELKLSPDACFLTCETLGYKDYQLRVANTRHLILNMADVCNPPGMNQHSHPIPDSPAGYPSFAARSMAPANKGIANTTRGSARASGQ